MPGKNDDEGFNFDEMEAEQEKAIEAAAATPPTSAPKTPKTPASKTPKSPSAATPAAVKTGGPPTPRTPATPAVGDALPEAEVPPPEDDYRRPVQLYKHWVRPKFLQYRYMYDYRTNYYNDVIEYLDKRAKGVNCEIPRAQTWAERVLRTHTTPSVLDYYKNQKKEDRHLIQTIAASIKTHNYHTRAYINQRYSSVL